MAKRNFLVSISAVILLFFGVNSAFAQCGPDGTSPCPKTTPKKTVPKTPTKKPTVPTVTKTTTPVKKPTTTTKPQPKPPTRFVPRAPNVEMVSIPAGSFMMGSDKYESEKPVHRVNISSSFYMGKYEVTQAQWKAVMGNNPSYSKNCGDDCPVDQVSWNDVQKFVQKLNVIQTEYVYRLPSESEWEYVCRAGTTTVWEFGDNENNLDNYAWSNKPGDDRSHKVGQKKSNNWGLYDMHGNVWEWCEDVYKETYRDVPINGSTNLYGEDLKSRVQRGGSCVVLKSLMSSSSRRRVESDSLDIYSGFRVVALPKLGIL